MGSYTGLRVDVQLLPEYVPVIEALRRLRSNQDPRDTRNTWLVLAEEFPQHQVLADWGAVHRADFIPFGALNIMGWDDEDERWRRRLTGDNWVFQCSLKNYEGEIQTFLSDVLPVMVSKINSIQTQHESQHEPTILV